MSEAVQKLKKADRTRRALLDAALQVIGQKGFSSATVDEIVRKAGVSKGVAYYHFKSKEEMASSILDQEFALLQNEFLDLVAREQSPQAVLMGMLDVFASRLYNQKDLAQLFSTEMWRSDRAWSDGVRESAQALIDLIATQLKQGQQAGQVRKDIDPTFSAASIVGMVVVDAMYCINGAKKPLFTREEFIARIYDFVHHAIAVA